MNEQALALLAWSLGAACLLAVGLARGRPARGRRGARLLMGAGAAVGGLALLLISLTRM